MNDDIVFACLDCFAIGMFLVNLIWMIFSDWSLRKRYKELKEEIDKYNYTKI